MAENILFPNTKPGCRRTPEYACWWAMRDRCNNQSHPHYQDYGGRGIRVCERWAESLAAFREDMGPRPSPRHSVDRIDNTKGYDCGKCPDCDSRGAKPNCRWATATEQMRNRRDNQMLTHEGMTLWVGDWARLLGINRVTLKGRLRAGWSVEKAFTTPVDHKKGSSNGGTGRSPGVKPGADHERDAFKEF